MEWDETGISVCAFLSLPLSAILVSSLSGWIEGSFYRAAVPDDLTLGEPDPSNWGVPVAFLSPAGCDPLQFFVNQSIIFG